MCIMCMDGQSQGAAEAGAATIGAVANSNAKASTATPTLCAKHANMAGKIRSAMSRFKHGPRM